MAKDAAASIVEEHHPQAAVETSIPESIHIVEETQISNAEESRSLGAERIARSGGHRTLNAVDTSVAENRETAAVEERLGIAHHTTIGQMQRTDTVVRHRLGHKLQGRRIRQFLYCVAPQNLCVS